MAKFLWASRREVTHIGLKDGFMQFSCTPVTVCLLLVILFLVSRMKRERISEPVAAGTPTLAAPKLGKLRRDFTLKELRAFDGKQAGGRVLIAVNDSVYDVTKRKALYGPSGPFAAFAGGDASRALAKLSVPAIEACEYDDLSDLTAGELHSLNTWEVMFRSKYELVGILLSDAECPPELPIRERECCAEENQFVEEWVDCMDEDFFADKYEDCENEEEQEQSCFNITARLEGYDFFYHRSTGNMP